MRVLLVEDETVLAEAIARGLRHEAIAADVSLDGEEALAKLAVNRYDVVVLDRDLPVVHGDDVCRQLAANRSVTRILMLTASDTVEDRVEGLSLGADDYLPKPFAFSELVARIRALARRSGEALPPVSLSVTACAWTPPGARSSATAISCASPGRSSACSRS